MRCAALICVFWALVVGCDRQPSPASGNAPSAQPAEPILRLSTLTPLQPDRQTHFTVDTIGNILWVQESDGDNDIVYAMSSGTIPQSTRLTSKAILAAMKVEGGSGSIQSLSPAPDGGIYFFFAGGTNRDVIACIGYFRHRASELRILASTDQIQAKARMGASLALARGTLVPAGAHTWLWIRHTDGAAFLQFESLPPPESKPLELQRPFNSIRIEHGEIVPAGDLYRVGVGRDQSLILVDLFNGTLWNIDSQGNATISWSLVGLPQGMSAPVVTPAGDVLIFASDSKPLKERTYAQIADPVIRTTYPALLLFGQSSVSAIDRSHIYAYSGFPVYQLQLSHFVPEKGGRTWISYDRTSGELVRCEILNR